MIQQIDLENFALFRHVRLTLQDGFTVITGESGAGKSLLLESLAAIFGARLPAERIGPFQEKVRIRATLILDPQDWRWEPLVHLGIAADSVLIIERTTTRDGRTSYRAQGEPVPAGIVRGLGEATLRYVGQNQALQVADPGFAIDWLDRYAHLGSLRDRMRAAFEAWQRVEAERKELENTAQELDHLDEKRQLWEELQALGLRAGEEEELQEEVQRLRASRQIVEAGESLYRILEGEEAQDGLLALVARAGSLAEALSRWDDRMASVADNLREVEAVLSDVRLEVGRWQESLDLDPRRLDALEERLDVLSRIKRRFGPTLEEVLRFRDQLQDDIQRLEQFQWDWRTVERRRDEALKAAEEAAEALSRARQEALPRAGEELTRTIRALEMPTGMIRLERHPAPLSVRGQDAIEWAFSASRGQPLKPLSKVASGGELARVALALAVTAGETDDVVYVFDEVDQGLSGRSAERVGQLLQRLGQRHQVIAVSHQPVVAARAARHLAVSKHLTGPISEAIAQDLDPKGRIREIARMLSASDDAIALQHAEALLAQSGEPFQG
ncbi:MAG: AAA family ATPase [Firmicutes bacterium]|nr:AAA family ATPase [Bacillota bacterium]